MGIWNSRKQANGTRACRINKHSFQFPCVLIIFEKFEFDDLNIFKKMRSFCSIVAREFFHLSVSGYPSYLISDNVDLSMSLCWIVNTVQWLIQMRVNIELSVWLMRRK